MTDTRIAYGAHCTWWGSIYDIGKRDGLPCCPCCRNMLFEMPDEATWWRGVEKYEQSGNPGYRKMIEWSRKRCFPTFTAMKDAYAALKGDKTDD